MPQTPYFPAWRSRLANLGRHLESFACQPLLHLEQIFAPLLPPGLLSQSDEGPNSRERLYSLSRTFWAFLYQAFNPGCPCREAVRQVLCHLGLHDARPEEADPNNSAYCTARKRLPLQVLQSARQATAVQAQRRLPAEQSNWLGHDTKVLDGSTLSTADTPQNQRHYPQLSNQKPGCGFPLMKVLGLFDLMSGALLGYAKGNKHKSELGLLRQLLDLIKPNDVLLADRGFCNYVLLALLQIFSQAYAVLRLHSSRKVDFRRGKKLGPGDALFTWNKPLKKPGWLPKSLWQKVSAQLTVRVVRICLQAPGFRSHSVTLVTTLLDPQAYPALELGRLYLRRWRIELWFRHLKTTMKMEHLRCLTPAMVHKELEMYFIAYNLIRCVMVEAAGVHQVAVERISFKGAVDTLRQYSIVLAQAKTKKKRRELVAMMLSDLAHDPVPERPGRREPRAVKRRPKAFALLTKPRHQFKDVPHRNRAWRKK